METIRNDKHPTDEQIEKYAEGRLPAAQVAAVSEHLFECDNCNERYEKEAEFLIQMRQAKAGALAESATRVTEDRVPFWARLFASPSPWLAAAAAAVLLLFFVPRNQGNGVPVVAELTALRSAGSVKAPANRPLQLRLDPAGASVAEQVRAEMADSAGTVIWSGKADLKDGRWETTVDRKSGPGQYWVRVYALSGGDALREYSLQLER